MCGLLVAVLFYKASATKFLRFQSKQTYPDIHSILSGDGNTLKESSYPSQNRDLNFSSRSNVNINRSCVRLS